MIYLLDCSLHSPKCSTYDGPAYYDGAHTIPMHTPISKTVARENGDWQLSNGNCTTEWNCGFHIWYAKKMSSSRGAKLILPFERPTGSGLTPPFTRNLEI